MCASKLFAGLTRAECFGFASCATNRIFRRSEHLFTQGEVPSRFMLIETGTVKLTRLGKGGDEVILAIDGAGEVVGLNLHSADRVECHTCTACAIRDSKALCWNYADIGNLLHTNPVIRGNSHRLLLARLEEMEERYRELISERASRRIALALLRLAAKVGKTHPLGVRICLMREEMAQFSGTTIFTTCRILSRWHSDGIIVADRDAVILCDPKRLERQADLEQKAFRVQKSARPVPTGDSMQRALSAYTLPLS